MEFNRRDFLKVVGASAGISLLPEFLNSAFAASSNLIEPKRIFSKNGILSVTLTAEAQMVPYNGGTRWALTYNRSLPGPTLVAKPGDTLKIKLVNKTKYSTNLHTHGLHVSPEGNSDNPMIEIAPNKSFDYVIKIPKNQRSGTFWYHPHHHHFVAKQLHAGLAGAIIITDALDEQELFKTSSDRVLLFSDPRIGKDASVMDTAMMDQMHGRMGDQVFINNQVNPTFSGTKSERWRLINASPTRYLTLTIPGATTTMISTDGGRLAKPSVVKTITLTPGQRYEVLVKPKSSGSIALLNDGKAIATIKSPSNDIDLSKTTFGNMPVLKATKVRHISIIGAGMMNMGSGMNHEMSFTFDGKPFDHNVVNQSVKLGNVEDWVITNKSNMDHPFHIHAWDFQIVDRGDGYPVAGWKDTVNVPAQMSVRIRINFADFGGTTVYHCHILDHEDNGMMGIVKVS